MSNILIVDDESNLREMLEIILSRDQHTVSCADSGITALEILADPSQNIQVMLTDMRMDHMDGLQLIERCQQEHPQIVCIVMTAYAEWDNAVKAMKLGAYNFIRKPFDNNVVRSTINRACNMWEQRQEKTKDNIPKTHNMGEHAPHIIGSSDHVLRIQQMIEQISTTDASILICGESGTGKELVAHSVHYHSLRSDGPMIRINSGALTETLLESELFGHKKGAFTGAIDDRPGMFELADTGTLFLDEVGELSLNTQVKLLRVLESGEFLPVGGTETQHCDVRVVAATNRNLQEMVKAETFRQDLYYRLAIITMELAPLRERREDIPLLAGHLLKRHAIRLRRGVKHFTQDAIHALTRFSWPGNIRELDNRIQRGVALTEDGDIELHALFGDFDDTNTGMWRAISPAATESIRRSSTHADSEKSALEKNTPHNGQLEDLCKNIQAGTTIDLEAESMNFERQMVQAALKRTDHNLTEAAKILGMSFRQMRYKVKTLGLR